MSLLFPPLSLVKERLELVLAPGRGAGPLLLGAPVGDILRHLRKQQHQHDDLRAAIVSKTTSPQQQQQQLKAIPDVVPFMSMRYSHEHPLAEDVVVELPDNGISMVFSNPSMNYSGNVADEHSNDAFGLMQSQSLRCIVLYRLDALRLVYHGTEFCSHRTQPTCLLISRLFGPTHPGEFDVERSVFTLSYPGIAFEFAIPQRYAHLYTDSVSKTANRQQPLQVPDLVLEFPDGTTPVCSRIYVAAAPALVPAGWSIPPAKPKSAAAATNAHQYHRRLLYQYAIPPNAERFMTTALAITGAPYYAMVCEATVDVLASSLNLTLVIGGNAVASHLGGSQIQSDDHGVTSSRSHPPASSEAALPSVSATKARVLRNDLVVNQCTIKLGVTTAQEALVLLGPPQARSRPRIRPGIAGRVSTHGGVRADAAASSISGDRSRFGRRYSSSMSPQAAAASYYNDVYGSFGSEFDYGGGSSIGGKSGASGDSGSHVDGYIHYYVAYGIDLHFDGISHRVRKIVLHGNLPGHYDFGATARCPYRIIRWREQSANTEQPQPEPATAPAPQQPQPAQQPAAQPPSNSKRSKSKSRGVPRDSDESPLPPPPPPPPSTQATTAPSSSTAPAATPNSPPAFITCTQSWQDVVNVLGSPDGSPLILSRGSSSQNPFGSTLLHGYNEGLIFEVTKAGHIANICIF